MKFIHPEQVWISNITYIGGRERNYYLALVTDVYSKKIMGYDLSDSLAADTDSELDKNNSFRRAENILIYYTFVPTLLRSRDFITVQC